MNKEHFPIYYKGHPKLYVKRKPIFWWTHKWSHFRFILRELTSVAVAFYSLIIVFQFRALKSGPEAYENFILWMKSPTAIVLNMVAFIFALYHSITWFNLAPKAMVIRIGVNKVPGSIISGMNYVAWFAVSIAIGWILLF